MEIRNAGKGLKMALNAKEKAAALETLVQYFQKLDDKGIYAILETAKIMSKQAQPTWTMDQETAAECVREIIDPQQNNIIRFPVKYGG